MRVTLNESEIKDALIQYVAGHGVAVAGRDVSVSLVAGRGPNGHSATIDISNAGGTTASSYLSDTPDITPDVPATVGVLENVFPYANANADVKLEKANSETEAEEVGSAEKSLFGN